MGFIPNGLYLYTQFMILEEKNENILWRCKRLHVKMWSVVLVCCNQDGVSFKIQVVNRTWIPSRTFQWHVWSCITWSLKMEEVKKWSPLLHYPIMCRRDVDQWVMDWTLKIMFMDMKRFEIKGHTTCSQMTSWNICGH